MRTVCIIQARMGSTRLPGKVLKRLADKEILWHVRTRVAHCDLLDDVIVATSTKPEDDVITEYCRRHGWPCFRGSERDVLSRYFEAARQARADIVVRVTCDCPLIDPGVIGALIARFDPSTADYMSINYPKRTYPVGLDCEIMTFAALEIAHRDATTPYDREHVTPYIYNHPDAFALRGLNQDVDQSSIRVTVDTSDDYRLVSNIYDALYQDGEIISTDAVVRFVEASTR
jgi:spore coat polysaccharide biosynthesis protein SpsF